MTYKCFKGGEADTTHERMAFSELDKMLRNEFEHDEYQDVMLLGNFLAGGSEIDAAIIKNDAIIVLDIKNAGGTLINADINREWRFVDKTGEEKKIKSGSRNNINPFSQIRKARFNFLEWLEEQASDIIKLKHPPQTMVYFSNPMAGIKNMMHEFYSGAESSYFFIADVNNIVETLNNITNNHLQLKHNRIKKIVDRLGLSENNVSIKSSDSTTKTSNEEDTELKRKYAEAIKVSKDKDIKTDQYKNIAEMAIQGIRKTEQQAKEQKETNKRLEEQNKLLKEQNRLFAEDAKKQGIKKEDIESFRNERLSAAKGGQEIKYSSASVLKEVKENVSRGKNKNLCTELIFSDGQQKYIKIDTFDRDLMITKKAKSLIGKTVQVSTWVSKDIDWSKWGYFNDIYEANNSSERENKPEELSTVISYSTPIEIPKSKPKTVVIKNVVMRDGKYYKSNWSRPMFEVETDVGTYISPTMKKYQQATQDGHYENWSNRIGDKISVFTRFDGEHYWINSLGSSNQSDVVSLSKIIPFNIQRSVKITKVSLENGRKYKSNWSKPMYEVQTELGAFIAATIKNHQPLEKQGRFVEWDKEQGKTLKVWTYSDPQVKELYWIGAHPEAKTLEASLDDEIPF